MADLKTDYVNDVLDTDVNNERTYNLVDANGNLIYEGIKIRETTVLATTGDNYGAPQINEQNETINQINADLSDTSSGLPSKVGKSDFSLHVFSLKPPSGTYQTATIDVSKPGLKAIACTGLNSSGNAVVLSNVYGWILDVGQQTFSASFSGDVSAYALRVYILYVTE